MSEFYTDAVIAGAGVIGLAIARKLATEGKEVFVLEANPQFGEETSSRNSEVIHAGIYYPKNSEKAKLCVAGRLALYEYAEAHNVPVKKIGKWIIAVNQEQADRLAGIKYQAEENGVLLSWGASNAIVAQLPGINVSAALWSPETGIIDSHQLMLAFVKEIESNGGHVVGNSRVTRITRDQSFHKVHVSGNDESYCVSAPIFVNAAGLGANDLARNCEGIEASLVPELYFAKGNYFSYTASHPFTSLVYPLPEDGGLGVHLTLDMAGGARFGPDVEWLPEPTLNVNEKLKNSFFESIRRWWPSAKIEALSPAYAGIRPKLKGPGEGFFDFQVLGPEGHNIPGMVHLFGIESPGLTSSLAIADLVDEKLKA
jgi:L-2-hydroxyglutarate oxidase LhgO